MVEEDGSEGDSVESPEDGRGSGDDGGGSGSAARKEDEEGRRRRREVSDRAVFSFRYE